MEGRGREHSGWKVGQDRVWEETGEKPEGQENEWKYAASGVEVKCTL